MRYVPFAGGAPEGSVLGLGCAAMMGSVGRRESLHALHGAYDAGINFFDTARSYGFGAGEALLGEFCAGRRDRIVLCTKFGILPPAPNWKQAFKPLARGALKLLPGLRRTVRRYAGDPPTPNQFSVAALRNSLETSLRELRTDYVDILLMHAAPLAVLAQDDLLRELERVVAEGKVRVAGISGDHAVIAAALAGRHPALRSAQFACNVTSFGFLEQIRQTLAESHPPMFLVANQPFGGALGVKQTAGRIAALALDPTLAPTFAPALREKLDLADPRLLPEIVLNAILCGTGIQAAVPAMMHPQHLERNCRAIAQCRFTAVELSQLRQALAARQ
jgi:aryl-alcohol dehydrogenase-like predicted oxidoreductase